MKMWGAQQNSSDQTVEVKGERSKIAAKIWKDNRQLWLKSSARDETAKVDKGRQGSEEKGRN